MLSELLSTVFERRHERRRAGRPDGRPLHELAAELRGARGETSGLAVARSILDRYETLDDDRRLDFFRHLALDMTIEPAQLRKALEAYEARESRASYRALMEAAEPPRQELIRRLNQVRGATQTLVGMRADLIRLGRGDDALQALDLDFRHLFSSWFNRGFLVLKRINWESPAHVLEKIITYEAVHAIGSWEDLRRRVQPTDRRCFAFFHPAMPDEPPIFVEVALTHGIANSIQTLLAEGREKLPEESADTAVFYSISNCQAGLAGISFGNSLIKQVAADLSLELPWLKTFVTLSPIPGLMDWLRTEGRCPDTRNAVEMRRQAAAYLLNAKKPGGIPLDPVARFHLGNGASVHQINFAADTSQKGQAQSAGVMVNYLYDLAKVAQNHELFATKHKITASPEVRRLAAEMKNAQT